MRGVKMVEKLICVLTRIADCLERIEKALPGGTQEALSRIVEREVNQMFQSALSDHTRVEYK